MHPALKDKVGQIFRTGQRVGFDLLPRHFYSSVPDMRSLSQSLRWRRPSEMPGVRGTDVGAQLDELESWFTPEVRETLQSFDAHAQACAENGADGYGPMEAQILHAFVATRRPKRIVQVGAGVSTSVILTAAEKHGVEVEVVAVDPYPTDLLRRLAADNRITLIEEEAQVVDMEVFTSLGAGDLLFVDSTHTVKPDSEVNRLVLEVFPRLASGVVTHVHDVMFPFDFPVDLMDRVFFWNESTLLHAYLIDNARTSILVSSSWLAHEKRSDLDTLFSGYRPAPIKDGLFDGKRDGDFPSSTYLITQG